MLKMGPVKDKAWQKGREICSWRHNTFATTIGTDKEGTVVKLIRATAILLLRNAT